MQTRIYDTGEKKSCYIDKEDFEKLVNEGKIKITKEYPNWRYKECGDIDYILMNKEDWNIEVSEKEKCLGQTYKYCIHSNLGRFPDEPLARYKKINVGYKGMITRYKVEFDEGIGFEENGGSANIYANDRNGIWRTKLIEAGFNVIDVD